ncbi:Checkpoint kinase 2 [Coelomomyces lativittatus]|nr:Checkpoint kinase 2 [Coelomomyces lativittatus]
MNSKAFRNCIDMETLENVPEIKIMKNLSHPNIVKVYDLYQTDSHVFIFLKLVEGGELFEYLATHRKIPEHDCKFWMYQLFLAVKFLHDHNIAHRDIKPENVLLESFNAKSKIILGDFGLAKVTPKDFPRMTSLCGTLNYAAPEVLQVNESKNPGYSKIADSWSLGIMLYFLICARFPFEGCNDNATRSCICTSPISFETSKEWSKVSENCIDLIVKLLNKDPDKRLTVENALKHPWIMSEIHSLEQMYKLIVKNENPM